MGNETPTYNYLFVATRQYESSEDNKQPISNREQLTQKYPLKELIKVIRDHTQQEIEQVLTKFEDIIPDEHHQVTGIRIVCESIYKDLDPHIALSDHLETTYQHSDPNVINKILESMAYVGFKLQRKKQKGELLTSEDQTYYEYKIAKQALQKQLQKVLDYSHQRVRAATINEYIDTYTKKTLNEQMKKKGVSLERVYMLQEFADNKEQLREGINYYIFQGVEIAKMCDIGLIHKN